MSITKQCTRCGEVKALDTFSADKRSKDGKRSQCKGCFRKYCQENRERISERKRKYHQENRERINEKSRKYRQENKERLNEQSRKYHQENKERICEMRRKYHKENPEVMRRANRKRRAMKRNLPHQPLTPQQYDILHRQKYEIFGGNASGN